MTYSLKDNSVSAVLYHGSGKLYGVLKPRYSDLVKAGVVYATQVRAAAICFAATWNDDIISFGENENGFYLKENVPKAFDVFKKEGWVYTVPMKDFKTDARLCNFERITNKEVTPLHVEHIKNLYNELKKTNILFIPH